MSMAVVLFGDPAIEGIESQGEFGGGANRTTTCAALGSSHCECTLNFARRHRIDWTSPASRASMRKAARSLSEPRAAIALPARTAGLVAVTAPRKRRNNGGSDHAEVTQDPNA
jgi:hypothetical protein